MALLAMPSRSRMMDGAARILSVKLLFPLTPLIATGFFDTIEWLPGLWVIGPCADHKVSLQPV